MGEPPPTWGNLIYSQQVLQKTQHTAYAQRVVACCRQSGRTEADEFFVEKTVITTDEELIASGASGDDSDHGEPVLSPSESHNQTKNPASHESNSQRETPSSPYRPENSTPTSPYCPKNSPTP